VSAHVGASFSCTTAFSLVFLRQFPDRLGKSAHTANCVAPDPGDAWAGCYLAFQAGRRRSCRSCRRLGGFGCFRHFLGTDFGCASAEFYRAVRLWHGNGRHRDRDHAGLLHVELVGHLRSKINHTTRARYGPRSSTLTVAVLPLLRLVTFAVVPSGKVILAATFELGLKRLPSAIFRLSK